MSIAGKRRAWHQKMEGCSPHGMLLLLYLSKIYNSLLETSSSKTSPTASFRSDSVTHKFSYHQLRMEKGFLKYWVQKRKCCWSGLNYFLCFILFQGIVTISHWWSYGTNCMQYWNATPCTPYGIMINHSHATHWNQKCCALSLQEGARKALKSLLLMVVKKNACSYFPIREKNKKTICCN